MDLSPSEGIGRLALNERRTYPRHLYHRKIICQIQGGPPDDIWLMGDCQNISLAGIGFVLHRSFDPGTLLTVDLEGPKRDSWGTLQARIMHCTPRSKGNWMVGCAFVSALSDGQLQEWLNRQENKVAAPRLRI